MEKFNVEYNKKIFYLVCKFLSQNAKQNTDEYLSKQIFQGEKRAKSLEHILMVKTKKIFESYYSLSIYNKKTLNYTYEKFTGIKLVESVKLDQLDFILKTNLKNDFNLKNAISIFSFIVKEKPFPTKNLEMAKFLFNLLRIMNKQIPIIFYPNQSDDISNLIQKNYNKRVYSEFLSAERRTLRFNMKHPIIKAETIIYQLNEMKLVLKEKFGIKQIFIYGSYARNEENEYSDLDLLVEIEKSYERKISYGYLFYFLTQKLNIRTDGFIMDSTFKEEFLTIDMKRDIKLAIKGDN